MAIGSAGPPARKRARRSVPRRLYAGHPIRAIKPGSVVRNPAAPKFARGNTRTSTGVPGGSRPSTARRPTPGVGRRPPRRLNPEQERQLWSTSPCVRCSRRASTSDTRPATGHPRWRRTSTASATTSTSSTSSAACRRSTRRPTTSARSPRRTGACCSSAPSAPRAIRSRRRPTAAACPTSTGAGPAA